MVKKVIHLLFVCNWYILLFLSGLTYTTKYWRNVEILTESRLRFKRRKFILNCYWNLKNVAPEQRLFRRLFKKNPPVRLTIAIIRDTFEPNVTIQNVHKQCRRIVRSSTNTVNEERLLDLFLRQVPALEKLDSKINPRSH